MTGLDRMHQRTSTIASTLAVCGAAMLASLLLHCDESLPPRDDPQNFLEAQISNSGGPVTVYVPDVIYGGTVTVTLTNLLDEVLESDSSIWVTVQMWPKGFPEKTASLVAGSRDLLDPGIIHNGLVTLRPDNPAVFVKQWLHRADDGTAMWDFGSFRREFTANGTPYCADSVHIIARASVKLFKHVAPVETPETELIFVYHVFGIEC